ncbi:MAG: GGDEF domain-containing protein [Campylobacterota bacterium]|nr:GGDEF domain-containing protein [Campylobacterota bacterium]
MKINLLNLIKDSCTEPKKFQSLEKIYTLYEQLQYSLNLEEMAQDIDRWLDTSYFIDNVNFALFHIDNNTNESIYSRGESFYLDDENSFYFIINTQTDLNAIVSFSVNSRVTKKMVEDDYDTIQAAFYQISPIIQNGIIKKHYIESSSLDSVTHVYNRKYLTQHIQKIISLSGKDHTNIAFLMIGIDHFKAVIDEFDYDIGDKVLVELAKVIHSHIDNFDIVARLTGDEFLVSLTDLKNNQQAVEVAEKIIKDFAQSPILINAQTQQTLNKTICAGISYFPQDGETINHVMKNADMFLYEAKNKGRSQYAIYVKEEESSINLF